MRLYAGMSEDFISDAVHNRIAGKLADAFLGHFRHRPQESEVRSWRESLRALSQVFQHADLLDHGILLEYQLPLTSRRLDCLISGHDATKSPQAVILELKQWQRCEPTDGEELVRTWVAKADRDVLHPSAQAGQYCEYLADTHTAFYDDSNPVALSACSYLHNYFAEPDDPLFASKFDAIRERTPVFDGDDVDNLTQFLVRRLEAGNGKPVLEKIEQSRFRPSKKLLDHVAAVVKIESSFVLLDEQRIVYQKVLARIRSGIADRKKQVFVVHGGPGTGKSVIAINLLADLAREGFNSQYATGSRAFTKTLHNIVGARASAQFRYFHNYGEAAPNDIDVLINDEAHRIRLSSNNRYTPASKKRSKRQIEELLDAAKVSVFLIDDKQVVRPNEVGSSELIRDEAQARGCDLLEFRLEAQFRCAGSDAFVNWVNNTLEIERTANPIWDQRQETFEFRIFESPDQLEAGIRAQAREGNTARVTAGFCWPWSKTVRADGTLEDDVVIGAYKRPWNARSEARGLARGIPREVLWARDPKGIDQVGCIYTAQGFEFDYVGVIWGEDFIYDADGASWVGDKNKSHDAVVKKSRDRFVDLVKNTYRVLLTRGMKGCYVCFLDKGTERFVRSRTEGLAASRIPMPATPERQPTPQISPAPSELPFRKLPASAAKPFRNCVPLWDLKIAAGQFRNERQVDNDSMEWVELPPEFQPRQGLFVARVVGESMNRRVPNGAWCLFRSSPGGSKQGRVVVATHRDMHDTEVGGNYTVKVYESEKISTRDGAWEHSKIVLKPDSNLPGFKPMVFEGEEVKELEIVAELVAVLG